MAAASLDQSTNVELPLALSKGTTFGAGCKFGPLEFIRFRREFRQQSEQTKGLIYPTGIASAHINTHDKSARGGA